MDLDDIKSLIERAERSKKEVAEKAKKFSNTYDALLFATAIAKMKPGDIFVNEDETPCVFVGWNEGRIINLYLDKEDDTITASEMSPCFVTRIITNFEDYRDRS